MWFAVIILTFFMLSIFRKLFINFNTLKFKYKLYGLRDELRKVSTGSSKDSEEEWLLDYYDNTLSKTIKESYYLTLFHIIMLQLKHNEKNLDELYDKLNTETKKRPALLRIQQEFNKTITDYIFKQHYISYYLFVKPILVSLIGVSGGVKKIEFWISRICVFPETSDSKRFVSNL